MKKRLVCGLCRKEFDNWLEVANHPCKAPNTKEHQNATK